MQIGPRTHPNSSQPLTGLQPKDLHTTICGIAAVVFGALGLVLSFIPIVNNIAAPTIPIIRAARGKVLSIVAAVLSVLAIVITLAMQSAASNH